MAPAATSFVRGGISCVLATCQFFSRCSVMLWCPRPRRPRCRCCCCHEEIDADSLGDWRAFRRNLAGRMTNAADEEPTSVANKISTENEKVLRTQNQVLANEYKTGAWAHETSMVCIHLLECIC